MRHSRLFALVTAAVLCSCSITGCKDTASQPSAEKASAYKDALNHAGYTLEQVTVLSRHNIRSPLSGSGSVLGDITNHAWYDWSSGASELSLRGGVLETEMGQFFRKWLEQSGLFPENYHPDEGAVRFYANAKQRTLATAAYFWAGFLPTAAQNIESHAEYDKMDPVFTPKFTFMSDSYAADVRAQVQELFTERINSLSDNYTLLEKIIDLPQSKSYQDGSITGFRTDDLALTLEDDNEPKTAGSLKTACSVSDALVLQYYEESDDKKAAFGHDLSEADWMAVGEVKDVYTDVLFTAPLVAAHVAHPILNEIYSEMNTADRQFTFLCGHDSNVASVLAALQTEAYQLPEAIEQTTPIGCKLVFSRWRSADNQPFISVDLVYQTVSQLRTQAMLDLNNPPAVCHLALSGLTQNADGLYAAGDVMKRFEDALALYDSLYNQYAYAAAA